MQASKSYKKGIFPGRRVIDESFCAQEVFLQMSRRSGNAEIMSLTYERTREGRHKSTICWGLLLSNDEAGTMLLYNNALHYSDKQKYHHVLS